MAKSPKYWSEPIEIKDWLGDESLSRCNPAARGIWIDIILVMSLNGRTGKLSGTVAELSRMCRCNEAEMSDAISELDRTKTADVRFCNNDVSIICRRMQKEYKRRENNKLYVAKHRKKDECKTDVRPHIQYTINNIQDNTPLPPLENNIPAKPKKPKFDASCDAVIPDVLNTDKFKKVWVEWCEYRRKEKRNAIGQQAAKMQLAKLAEYGEDAAISTIQKSIENSWQGLFPDKFANTQPRGEPQTLTVEQIAAMAQQEREKIERLKSGYYGSTKLAK